MEKTPQKSLDYSCTKCLFICGTKKDMNRHVLTTKHKKNCKKSPLNYSCEICAFSSSDKNNHTRHILTTKHKKNCKKPVTDVSDAATIKTLVDQNAELLLLIKEMMPQIGNNNNTMIVHNENKFNINIFLNEKCKDAMNIKDFVDSIQLHLSDMKDIGQIGYVKGISNIIIKELNALDIYKRPIHCTDVKRDTLYIKDNDAWEKEKKDLPKIKKAIQTVSNMGCKLLCQLDFENDENALQLVFEMTGGGVEHGKQDDKIIKFISNATGVGALNHT